ncbi:hypothetical protein P3X46_015754 [Hevea brasiliensis]|uniref:Uncharacterized protein n=1 Tax=Hevea brasiliensis TaxID=3981 RepID=A0ABQ9M0Y0_HEVBR|nr:protein PIN-LIKES 3 [Hevea brasiliensis]KAJ9172524.1 hypothetical protein P3X46_015754 [Hevea brasiliensis]
MGFLDVLVVALIPVLEVLVVTGIGLSLALHRINLLGPTARHNLNNLVFYVLSPALVVSQLGETITFSSLVSLWFMPVNILLTFIIGSVFAWILIKITKTPPQFQGLVIGCCSAGNLGNLLLIVVPAVCEESNSPFGDSTICSTYGEAYASLSMAVGTVYIWTYVYFIMRIYADKSVAATNNHTNETQTFLESCTESLLLPSTENSSSNALSRTASEGKLSYLGRAFQRIKNFAEKINLKMVFAPSTIAAIIGFIIGTVSPIRKLIIGDSAPLRVLENSASLLGEATVPSMTLMVGANLYKGLTTSGVNTWVIVGIIGVRYILMPLLGLGVVKAAYHFGMVGSDSLYQFVLMLQYALPPAMAVGIIAQLFEAGESECSVIMLWTYVVAAFALTLWCTLYMWFI